MTIFRFFKWRPFAVLHLLCASLDHPRRYFEEFITVQNLVRIDAVVCIIFKCWHLTTLAWKCLFTPVMVFGGFYPLNGYQSHHDPKRSLLVQKHVIWRIDRWDLPTRFCTAYPFTLVIPQNVMLCNGQDISLKVPLSVGVSTPRLIHGLLAAPDSASQTQMAPRSVQLFLRSSLQSVPAVYNGPPLSTQIAPSHGWSGPHLIHCSLGPQESSTQTTSRSFSRFRRAHCCDIPTDGQTTLFSVCNNKSHLRTMRPKTIIHCESKKQGTTILSITSPNVDWFSNFFFTERFTSKYATKSSLTIPPH